MHLLSLLWSLRHPQNRSWGHGWGNRIVIKGKSFRPTVAGKFWLDVGNWTAAPSTKMHYTHTTAEENINNFVMMPGGGARPSATYFRSHERWEMWTLKWKKTTFCSHALRNMMQSGRNHIPMVVWVIRSQSTFAHGHLKWFSGSQKPLDVTMCELGLCSFLIQFVTKNKLALVHNYENWLIYTYISYQANSTTLLYSIWLVAHSTRKTNQEWLEIALNKCYVANSKIAHRRRQTVRKQSQLSTNPKPPGTEPEKKGIIH